MRMWMWMWMSISVKQLTFKLVHVFFKADCRKPVSDIVCFP